MKRWLPVLVMLAGCPSREESPPAPRPVPPPAEGALEQPAAPAEPASTVIDAAPQPMAAPDPPSLPGARLIANPGARKFGLGPGWVYWCDRDVLRATPKSGGGDLRQLGTCNGSFEFVGDADGVYHCESRGLVRAADGKATVLAEGDCLGIVVDDTHVYYVRPGFDGIPDPGVYRVAKAGGAPEKIYLRTPREQYLLALDGDALWIGHYGAGIIAKLPKAGGKVTQVVKGQKHMVDVEVDAGAIYWLMEDAAEVRRRARRGGAIEVIGRGVSQEPIYADQGHAYWFEGGEGQPKRLVHLAPGATEPETMVDGLEVPWLEGDADGVYLSQLDRPGIFVFDRAAP